MKNENYYTVFGWMRNDLHLDGVELDVYAIIWGFSQDGESKFHGSLAYLIDWTGKTKRTILNALASLEEKGLIQKQSTGNNTPALYTALREAVNPVPEEGGVKITPVQELHPGGVKITRGECKNYTPCGVKITPNNNINNTTDITKDIKHQYGQYKNVLLSDKELDKLKSEFPDSWERWIETLSEGIEMRGYKYKNHLAAIRNWARKDGEKAIRPVPAKKNQFTDFHQRNYDPDELERMLLNTNV